MLQEGNLSMLKMEFYNLKKKMIFQQNASFISDGNTIYG